MRYENFFLSLTICVMMTGCVDEDYGYSVEEIRRSAVERDFGKAFRQEFQTIDPHHDWMCTPDTTYYNMPRKATRALATPTIVKDPAEKIELPYDAVSKALDYMKEAEDNRGKCAQNFEYLAIEETTYEIYPTFWGRKFCDTNYLGIYYIDEAGKRHDLEPFWNDTQNCDGRIRVYYTDGYSDWMPQSTKPITDDPDEAWNETKPLVHKCSDCGGTGKKSRNRTCQTCGGKGTYPVDHYEMPKYTLTMPAGTKWGIYLRTRKCQDRTEMVNWYSNASYNPDHVTAAATFTYNGVTYCSFEDAPHNTHNGSGTGTCRTCGYGHYDTDFNDLVLTITPRPVESTYRAISYRVMCEDLGGTFDWDFNDVVYDVIYEDGKTIHDRASVSIVLQAVGGTLPIYLVLNGTPSDELHEMLSGQSIGEDGLYVPVNVSAQGEETITGRRSVIVHTIELEKQRYTDDELDVRSYVHDIEVQAIQEGRMTSRVVFPDQDGTSVPQCFMTSTGTEWPDELQNITDKYPKFSQWVASQQGVSQWWNTNPNF